MSKSILMSIHPEPCEYIFGGIKKREIRKVLPNVEFPCKVYVYMTQEKRLAAFFKKGDSTGAYDDKGNEICFDQNVPVRRYNSCAQKVIGEFICTGYDKLVHCGTTNHNVTIQLMDDNYYTRPLTKEFLNLCCLSYKQLEDYSKGGDLYALHITDVKLYKKPKELSEFGGKCNLDCPSVHCPYWKYQRVNADEWDYDCSCNNIRPLTRPPQSFCYVEEVE